MNYKSKRKKLLLICLCIVIVFSIIAFLGIGIAHSVIFGRYDYSSYDNERYIIYSDISNEYPREEIDVVSGENALKGYIYGSQNDTGLIIISPGHTDTNDIKLYEIMYFVEEGWRVLCYDYTGCYTSSGDSMHGYTQCVHDLDAILQYAENDDELVQMPVMLFGHSLGAYNSCAVLRYKPNIYGVVAASGFDTPREQWNYSVKRFTGPFHYILKPYTNLFINFKYGNEANLSAIDGINSTDIPVLVVTGINDEFYGGMSPIYEKRAKVTNPSCEFKVINTEGHDGHYDYFLTKQAIRYQNEIKNKSFDGKIDKQLYMEHDIKFMDEINQFFLSALPK